MRPRNTLLLLLVLAALGAYVYWVELPEEQRQAEEQRLLKVDPKDVAGLTLDYPDNAVTLEKGADGTWRVTKPLTAPADAAAVNAVVSALANAKTTRTLDDVGGQLGSYGLDKPEVVVTVRLTDGTTLPAVKIGKTTAVGASSYVQRGDDAKVLIAPAAFQAGMKRQLKDLRDKSLLAFDDPKVTKVSLLGASGPIDLERTGDGDEWTITAPLRQRADPAEVRALLAAIRGLRADDFVSDDPNVDLAQYGLAPPRFRVDVTEGEGTRTLLIGKEGGDDKKKVLYARRADAPGVVTIPDYAIKSLDKDLTTLRDKTILAFPKDEAVRIVATRKDGAGFTLVKQDGVWSIAEPPGEGAVRIPTITRFLDDLAGLKGNTIVDEGHPDFAAHGLADPDLTVVVENAAGAPIATLVGARGTGAGTDEEAQSYLAAKGGSIVYGVKSFSYDRVDKKASDFREKTATPRPGQLRTPAPGAPPEAFQGVDEGGDPDEALEPPGEPDELDQ